MIPRPMKPQWLQILLALYALTHPGRTRLMEEAEMLGRWVDAARTLRYS